MNSVLRTNAIPVAVEAIDRMLVDRHRQGFGPGLSLALTTRDGLVATKIYGVANADRGDPVTDRTLFQIGSITKHFTAAACLRLVEQGRLNLSAPVTDYLACFKVGSSFSTPITLHHLLTHTAGIVMMIVQASPYPVPVEPSIVPAIPQKTKFIGPDCVVDYTKKITLQIPDGWYGTLDASSISIVNYDPDSIEYEHGKPKNLPIDNIKIEIYELKLKPDQTLEEWVSEEKAQTIGQDGNAPTVSENYPYRLGEYDGVAYATVDSMGWNSRIIALRIDVEKGIVINIFPADSQALSEALAFLATLDASGNTL